MTPRATTRAQRMSKWVPGSASGSNHFPSKRLRVGQIRVSVNRPEKMVKEVEIKSCRWPDVEPPRDLCLACA